jgi:hypothetical protein
MSQHEGYWGDAKSAPENQIALFMGTRTSVR